LPGGTFSSNINSGKKSEDRKGASGRKAGLFYENGYYLSFLFSKYFLALLAATHLQTGG
jgi:hypothetical protein